MSSLLAHVRSNYFLSTTAQGRH
uniref:Uncharacterized protein n=1 Tax=Anguilla anguilla TaxID=7936 RepID=A0A0E9VUA5_ANGAN